MTGLSNIDRRIGQEVGRLIWDILPDMHPGLNREEDDSDFPELSWTFQTTCGDQIDENIFVGYPVLYLGSERLLGDTDRAFEYPGVDGSALRLRDYLQKLRLFLDFRLTNPPEGSTRLLVNAVREVVLGHGYQSALEFVIKLWRGRWLCDDIQTGLLIQDLLAEGTDEGFEALLNDRPRAIEAAISLITRERELKEGASSTDDWLFEAYCLLPEIIAWLFLIRQMRKRQDDDELSKYDRVLDEFHADISTTICIPIFQRKGGDGLARSYALQPLDEASSIDQARRVIRGISRGRSIVPRVWYEEAMRVLDRIERDGLPARSSSFTQAEVDGLDHVDIALLFGCELMKNGKRDHWMTTVELFGFDDTKETPAGLLSDITLSFPDRS